MRHPSCVLSTQPSQIFSLSSPGLDILHLPQQTQRPPTYVTQSNLVWCQLPRADFHFPTHMVSTKGSYQDHDRREF